MSQRTNLYKLRTIKGALTQILVVALAVAFYVSIVPVAVLFSGPIYRALQCRFAECEEPGRTYEFVLRSSGALRTGSRVRLPNGLTIGHITGFRRTTDERFIVANVRIQPEDESFITSPIRCQVMANFNLEMDADLVVSACPGMDLPPLAEPAFVCGAVDHFQRMGQEVRHFVLEHIRPGEVPAAIRLTGPCGADNEAMTAELRRVLAE